MSSRLRPDSCLAAAHSSPPGTRTRRSVFGPPPSGWAEQPRERRDVLPMAVRFVDRRQREIWQTLLGEAEGAAPASAMPSLGLAAAANHVPRDTCCIPTGGAVAPAAHCS